MLQELRYGWRALWKRPGFTAVVIASLTLGMLPIIIVGSIINAVLLRSPKHVQAPERLAAVYVTGDPASGRQYAGLFYPEVIEIRRHVAAFADALAYSFDEFNFTDEAGTRTLLGSSVSENYFSLLGAPMLLGRGFAPNERETDTAVIGHVTWQRRFNGDPAIIGKTIKLDGKPRTVIGVAPQGLLAFQQPLEPEAYLPLPDDAVERRASRRLEVLARLRPGATIEQARSQLQALQAGLRDSYPQYWKDDGRGGAPSFAVFPESATRIPLDRRAEFTLAFSLLSFLALLVLATACANLASLLLARGAERGREIAVRLALGAQRRRVVTLLLAESLLLVGMAGAVGLLLTHWVSRALAAGYLAPGIESIGVDFTVDLRVAGIVAAVCLATGLLFGVAPALQASRLDLVSTLKGEPRFFGRVRRLNARNVFVTAQISADVSSRDAAGTRGGRGADTAPCHPPTYRAGGRPGADSAAATADGVGGGAWDRRFRHWAARSRRGRIIRLDPCRCRSLRRAQLHRQSTRPGDRCSDGLGRTPYRHHSPGAGPRAAPHRRWINHRMRVGDRCFRADGVRL